MKDLYLSELRRFRNGALIFTGTHVLLLLFANRLLDLPQQRWQLHIALALLYCLAGIGFALAQLVSYRQPSRWLWLQHRPLSRARIFGAIALAALTLAVLAVGLPCLASLIGIGLFSERTVDTRHYLAALHLVLITYAAWLAGAIAVTSRGKTAIVVMVLPGLLMAHLASGITMLAPALLCVAVLAWVAYCAFKPNRTGPPETMAALVATALPLQLGFYFALLWSGGLLYQCVLMLADNHPLNRVTPAAGSYTALIRMDGRGVFDSALASSTDARAPAWRSELKQLKPGRIAPEARDFPVRHQASNRDRLQWVDSAANVAWTFSHDAMRFQGRDLHTGRARGWLGAGADNAVLAAVPLLSGSYMVTPHALYGRTGDAAAPQIVQLLQLPLAETLTGSPKTISSRQYLLTNARLIAFAPAAGTMPALQDAFSVALPGPLSDLERVDIAELADGVLLSFDQGRRMIDGGASATQTVMFVPGGGAVAQTVAGRSLAHDFPVLFEHRAWWLSPILATLVTLPGSLLDAGAIADRQPTPTARPPAVIGAALLTGVLSALLAFAWLRRTALSRRRRFGWLGACLLLGPAALLSLLLLQPRAAAGAGSLARTSQRASGPALAH